MDGSPRPDDAPIPLTVQIEHLEPTELHRRYKAATLAVEARRWRLLFLVASGKGVAEAAELAGLTYIKARLLIAAFNAQGPSAVTADDDAPDQG